MTEVYNPCKWARENLALSKGGWIPWEANPLNVKKYRLSPDMEKYQETILNCPDRFVAMRLGRCLGKTEILSIRILYETLTKPDICAICKVPASLGEIFYERINELLADSNYKSDVAYSSAIPYPAIQFENESSILIFPSTPAPIKGCKGRRADMIIFDEAALLPDHEFDCVSVMLMESATVKLLWAGTPSKFGSKFFKNLFVGPDPDIKRFHLPGQVHPDWSSANEITCRKYLSEEDYKTEILAEWPEEDKE